jgi:hypothetical protein
MTTANVRDMARSAARTAGLAVFAASVSLGLATGMAHAETTGGMYGDPAAAAAYWQPQTYDDCVLMATADVVGQVTGQKITEQEIITVAEQTPSRTHPGPIYTLPKDKDNPNSGGGTSDNDIPLLLAHYGVGSTITDKNDAYSTGAATGMPALEQYLGAGRKVIVAVNAELIWGLPVDAKDAHGNPTADHALVATGVDTVNGIVHLNDSGASDGADTKVPLDIFTKAWAAGDDELIVTDASR